jgi:hypothetical protein
VNEESEASEITNKEEANHEEVVKKRQSAVLQAQDGKGLPGDLDTSRFTKKKLIAFQKEFPDIPLEELARYLIGKNDHLKQAEQQLRRALEKREELRLPILKSSVMNEMSTGKIYCHGVDKEGRPVLVWIASKNCVSKRNLDETMRLLIWWAEYTMREKLPPGKSKVTVLVHMDGTSNDNVDKELYKECLSSFQVCISP